MQLTRKGFTVVVKNAFSGLGFPWDAPTIHEFPVDMFLPASDLSPLQENIDIFVTGLTKWEPEVKEKGIYPKPSVKVEGKDYQDAVANMNLLFLKNNWSDGLPLLPATEERIDWILTGTDLSPDTRMGNIMPKAGIATVRDVAGALAVAGGRPEYLPVLLGVVECIVVPEFWTRSWNSTTNNPTPVVIVNGPIAQEIRLNSGYGCLGPSPLYPASAAIGRALRLMLQDIGGGIPGLGTMAIHGMGSRYANLVFAEAEEHLPEVGWPALSVERGFAPGENAVTVHIALSEITLSSLFKTTTDEDALETMTGWARIMRVPRIQQPYGKPYNPEGAPGILLMAPLTAAGFGDRGWSKDDVKKWLWDATTLTPSEVKEYGFEGVTLGGGTKYPATSHPAGSPLPLCVSPENIIVAVAGGLQSGHAFWMGTMAHTEVVQSKEVVLPSEAQWNALLEQAEADLGPIPVPMA